MRAHCFSSLPPARLPYSRTLAEAFGLVATEACARGIPCVSSRHGGLAEANTLATVPGFEECAIDTRLVHDHCNMIIRRDMRLDELEEEQAAARTARMSRPSGDPLDLSPPVNPTADVKALLACLTFLPTHEAARPYVEVVSRLIDDAAFYRDASDAARASGLAFIRAHRGTFGQNLEQLWADTQPPTLVS